jgi:predicted nuclease of predicted toxin-antitoxin system
MVRFLAGENMPGEVVAALRQAGHDVAWIVEMSPGDTDDAVLARSVADSRVLLTCDKDFGAMTFRQGKNASCGVVLLRPRLKTPDHVSQFAIALLAQTIDWTGHFTVAREGKTRVIPLS